MNKTDVLIIGSGVAGMSSAIQLALLNKDIQITLLTKVLQFESNTRYAQGGIAAVWDETKDNFDKHIADTLDAGDGLCNQEAVNNVVKEGPARVQEIIDWGTRFDKVKSDLAYDLGREGGHSENRILHYKDLSGAEMQRALMEKVKSLANITVKENYYAINLITQHHLGWSVTRVSPGIECYGAYVLNKATKEIETWVSKVTILATGGAGQIYRNTTNPQIATGDGVAMVYRAKGRVENMEFVQFHPTALYNPAGENPDFLVSEAVRGFGGILKTKDGEEFMHKYDARKSLAPRDIVARAIDNEMKIRGDDYVYLDCRHLDKEAFINHFPTINNKCLSIGIDPMKLMIPVVPACHYMCGGVHVDQRGKSSIQNLYAVGECSSTGLHGANRLASNSLLEALVYGKRIASDIHSSIHTISLNQSIPEWNDSGTTEPKEMVLITQSWKELKEVMSSYVGIVRSNVRLKRAMDRLHLLYNETEDLYNTSVLSPQLCELRNFISIGYLITRSASLRKESRGLHYTTDYPEEQGFLENTLL